MNELFESRPQMLPIPNKRNNLAISCGVLAFGSISLFLVDTTTIPFEKAEQCLFQPLPKNSSTYTSCEDLFRDSVTGSYQNHLELAKTLPEEEIKKLADFAAVDKGGLVTNIYRNLQKQIQLRKTRDDSNQLQP